MTLMENQLKILGSDFIAGNKFTIADCCMVAAIPNLFENPAFASSFAPMLGNFPKLQEYLRRLKRAFKERLAARGPAEAKPKIEYFGPFGRPDPIRFLLRKANVEFDDITVS